MENERVAFRVISAIELYRTVSDEERETIMKEVMSSTPEQLQGWETVAEIADEFASAKEEERVDADVAKRTSNITGKRVASMKRMKDQPKLGRSVASIPGAEMGVKDNLEPEDSFTKQIETLFDDEIKQPIPRQN